MKCPSCGAETVEGPFCSSCGASLEGRFPPGTIKYAEAKTSGMAIAGFVLAFFCGLLGIIFSALGYSECKKSNGAIKGQGLAIAGMVISIVSLTIPVLAAVAIPAFFDYTKKARSTEAEVELRRLERAVRGYHIMNGELPVDRAPLTPASSCCERECEAAQNEFQTAAWQKFDFAVYGRQHFQYSYESDGKSFVAKAVGDLDCDGVDVTYTLVIDVRDGDAHGEITKPSNRD